MSSCDSNMFDDMYDEFSIKCRRCVRNNFSAIDNDECDGYDCSVYNEENEGYLYDETFEDMNYHPTEEESRLIKQQEREEKLKELSKPKSKRKTNKQQMSVEEALEEALEEDIFDEFFSKNNEVNDL